MSNKKSILSSSKNDIINKVFFAAFFIMTVPFAVNPNEFFANVFGYEVRGVVVLENIGQALIFAVLQIDFIISIIGKVKKKRR